jgi:hypothetical protein
LDVEANKKMTGGDALEVEFVNAFGFGYFKGNSIRAERIIEYSRYP